MIFKSKETPQGDSMQHKLLQKSYIVVQKKKKKLPSTKRFRECYNKSKRSETPGSVSQQSEFAPDYHRGNFADPKMFAGANIVITAAGLAETGTWSSTMAAISSEFSWVSSLLCAN